MKVSIGSDHRGLDQRKTIASAISVAGHEPVDLGTFSTDSVDYPDIAKTVCEHVSAGRSDRGILICGTGIGMSIAANKVAGIRAALCVDRKAAELSRQHNNANVLCLRGDDFDGEMLSGLVNTWLETEFEGGRHARRVDKMMSMESGDVGVVAEKNPASGGG